MGEKRGDPEIDLYQSRKFQFLRDPSVLPRHQTISNFFFYLKTRKRPVNRLRGSADEKEREKETGHRKSISSVATERNVGEHFKRTLKIAMALKIV